MVRSLRTGPLVLTAVLLLCALIAGFAWLTSRVVAAATALTGLQATTAQLFSAAEAGDLAGAADAAQTVRDHARAAAAATSDPLWPVAEAMPWFGDDLHAVRTLSAQAATLADRVLDPVLGLIDASLAGSGIDPDLLASLGTTLDEAGAAVAETGAAVTDLDTSALLPPIRDGAVTVRDALRDASPTVDALAALTAFLGALVGDDGATVLVALQNPAELRTGGGITGSFVLLQADAGRFTLVEQTDSGDFPDRTTPIIPLPETSAQLYGPVVGRFVQNVSMPIDFAQTAELATAWWQSRGGAAPDAVIAVDPLALQGILAATGPVVLPDGTEVTGDNLAQRVLVDPYMTMDAVGQTAYLQSVSTAMFERLTSIEADLITWARALVEPIAEGRISLWSADAAAERTIAGTVLAGPAGRLATAGPDAFAVFLNDATGGKMDTFLHLDMALTAAHCRPDGRADVTVRLTMSSSAPPGADYVLPADMTGHGLFGTGAGDIGTSVSVVAPPGTFFGGVTKDGEREISVDVIDSGRPTSLVRINLSPSEVNVVEFRFVAAAPGPLDLRLIHTPLINAPTITVTGDGGCG